MSIARFPSLRHSFQYLQPRHTPSDDGPRSVQARCLFVPKGNQPGGGQAGQGEKARCPRTFSTLAQDLREHEGKRPVRRRPVSMLVRQLVLLARLEDDRQVRTTMAHLSPLALIDGGRQAAKAGRSTETGGDNGSIW